MAFLETRGMLAKLLATENIVVEHDQSAITASFDTSNRVLKLPVLSIDSENVYNMFVGHEVGHALQTPSDWHTQVPNKVPFDYVNVIEDVRIEKYIQSKFPGLRVDFARGYDYLNDNDFFKIKDEDVSQLSLIDRINLHFKLGVRSLIPFSDEEKVYVDAVDGADTWQKVLLVSKMITDYIGSKDKDKTEDKTEDKQQTDSTNQQQSNQNDSGDDTSGETESQQDTGASDECVDESVSKTQQSFDESISDNLKKQYYGGDYVYVKTRDINIEDYFVDIKTLRESYLRVGYQSDDVIQNQLINLNLSLKSFLSSIKGDVNHMVQQFEMKKSADEYSRSQVNKTGVIDTNLLHNYKLSEDIFLRHNVTPDGKNHGMVMLLDWSGSMSKISIETVKQVITLVQFCRKIQIPFDVYTFTSGVVNPVSESVDELDHTISYNQSSIVQVLSSTAKKREIDEDIFNLYNSAHNVADSRTTVYASRYMDMGGTPLNNVLMAIPKLIERFRYITNTQKVSFVCVTDGESSPLVFHKKYTYSDGIETIKDSYSYHQTVMIRDGFNVHPISSTGNDTVDVVKWLKTKLTDVSITNLYLGGLSASSHYLKEQTNYEKFIDEKVFRRSGCYVSTSATWPLIGVINPTSFTDSEDEIQVEDNASKSQIKTALKKYLKSKTSSRLVLTQLIGDFA